MVETGLTFKEKLLRTDMTIVICVVIMSALSLLTLSACLPFVELRCLLVQAFAFSLGMVLMMFIMLIDYDRVSMNRIAIGAFVLAIVALTLLLICGEGNGINKNWIRIPGFPLDIQVAEFTKILFILSFSRHARLVKERINRFSILCGLLFHAGVYIGFVLVSGDLGTALVYVVMALVILYASGLNKRYFIVVFLACLLAAPVLWSFLTEYQRQRILVGFNPWLDPYGYGYQPLISREAILSGGLFGAGYSGGFVYKILPVVQSDFLFSAMCEKFGMISGMIYVVALSVLVIRIFRIGRASGRRTTYMVCVGVGTLLFFQFAVNIGMCLGVLPVIGITSPFLSYGGSSMLTLFLTMGVIQAIKIRIPKEKLFSEKEEFYRVLLRGKRKGNCRKNASGRKN
ncbi:MAG: FtsW/RodA/SpoVE family cell cycle protein [Clostridia bacterium]|nr:FtsW/RodA/SpoVE family cell cycle protein [Clostridia bacterium]